LNDLWLSLRLIYFLRNIWKVSHRSSNTIVHVIDYLEISLCYCDNWIYFFFILAELKSNISVVFVEQCSSMSSVCDSIIDNKVQNSKFYAIFSRNLVSSSKQFNHTSFPFSAISLNSFNKSRSIWASVAIWLVFNNILRMVTSSFGQSLVKIKWPQRLLVQQKLLGFFPERLSLNCFIDHIFSDFDAELINKAIELFVD